MDLFIPYEYGYEFRVIITNKTLRPKRVAAYHEGRGSQEGIFGELKSHCHQDYIPVRTLHGNQTYLLAGLYGPSPVVLYQRELLPLARWAQIELYILSFCYLCPVNSDSSKTEEK